MKSQGQRDDGEAGDKNNKNGGAVAGIFNFKTFPAPFAGAGKF